MKYFRCRLDIFNMRWSVALLALVTCGVNGQNCRGEEQRVRACEKICDENNKCTVRAALLLPANTSYDASLPVVRPVLELALQSQLVKDVFPDWLNFTIQAYDVTNCDAAYGVISAIDAYNDCAHVFFGPACDFALASVARITKFLGFTGIPIITTGGFTFDFVQPKRTCDDEFYMLLRAGPLGFRDMAYFIIKLMQSFHWRQLLLITEPDAQLSVAGRNTCHLMMKTLANFLKIEDFLYTPWDLTSDGGKNDTENLKFYVGYKYANMNGAARLFCTKPQHSRVLSDLLEGFCLHKQSIGICSWTDLKLMDGSCRLNSLMKCNCYNK